MCSGGDREAGRGWQQGIDVERLRSSSFTAFHHPTVQFLHSSFLQALPWKDQCKYGSATVRGEMEPDIRHVGMRGRSSVIHNR